ncbi:MAG: M48 family metallopeptidase [Nodosilinea sp.]
MQSVKKSCVRALSGLLAAGALASAMPLQAGVAPNSLPSLDPAAATQSKSTATDQEYEQAKQDLPEDYYVLYRVVERIARANQLDSLAWRVIVDPEYDVNAYATDVNLLAFYAGLMDRLDNNVDAIACVVGHEMSHHTQTHIAISEAQREAVLAQLQAEAVEEVAAEEEDLRQDLEQLSLGTSISVQGGGLADRLAPNTYGLGGLLGGIVGGVLRDQQQQRLQAAAERIDAIYAEKVAIQEEQWTALSHEHEFEADEIGYYYMATAGFDPQGCLTAMEMLKRLGVTDSASHPATPDRITALEELMTTSPAGPLAEQGKRNLAARPNPLSYERSRDGVSLQINSQAGSGNVDDQFPQ